MRGWGSLVSPWLKCHASRGGPTLGPRRRKSARRRLRAPPRTAPVRRIHATTNAVRQPSDDAGHEDRGGDQSLDAHERRGYCDLGKRLHSHLPMACRTAWASMAARVLSLGKSPALRCGGHRRAVDDEVAGTDVPEQIRWPGVAWV